MGSIVNCIGLYTDSAAIPRSDNWDENSSCKMQWASPATWVGIVRTAQMRRN